MFFLISFCGRSIEWQGFLEDGVNFRHFGGLYDAQKLSFPDIWVDLDERVNAKQFLCQVLHLGL